MFLLSLLLETEIFLRACYQHSADVGGSQKSGTSTSAGNIRGEQILLHKMGTASKYSRTRNLHDGPGCYSSEGRTAHFRRLDVLETTQRGLCNAKNEIAT